jgi:hypothetical protein
MASSTAEENDAERVAHARRRQPVQAEGEDADEHEAAEEGGDRDAEARQLQERLPHPTEPGDVGEVGQHDGADDAEHQREERDDGGVGEGAPDHLVDWLAGRDRDAEVAAQGRERVTDVLPYSARNAARASGSVVVASPPLTERAASSGSPGRRWTSRNVTVYVAQITKMNWMTRGARKRSAPRTRLCVDIPAGP